MYRISNAGKTLAVQKIQILQWYNDIETNTSHTSSVHAAMACDIYC